MGWIDNLIGRTFGRKASATARGVYLISNGQPVWTPHDYEKLAAEGYEQNVTVYAAVNEVARAAAGIPWVLYQKGAKRSEYTPIEDHPLLTLLERPNPLQGGAEFFEAYTAFLLLTGNAYMERVGPDNPKAPPLELYTLRPDRVQVIPDTVNLVAAYRYKAGSTEQVFPATHVLHQKTFNATSDWYGLAPLVVAARAVDSDNAAQAWNVSLLQNAARPSGALVAKGNIADAQFDRLKKEVEDQYTGSANAGRPMLLEGDMQWIPLATNPADLDWLNGRKLAKQEICQAFGVPPELIGDREHATYSNFQEARKAFYQETILPYMDRLRDALNNWLTPLYGDRLWLDYDRDSIEALAEDRERLWTRVNAAADLTVNEKRAARGYAPIPGGDVVLVSAALIPIGDAGAVDTGATDAAKGTTPTNPPTLALQAKSVSEGLAGVLEALDAVDALRPNLKAFNLTNADARSQYWKSTDRSRLAWSGKVATKLRGHFEAEGNLVSEAASKASQMALVEREVLAAVDKSTPALERLLAASYLEVVKAFGEATNEAIKSQADTMERKYEAKAFDVFTQVVRQFIATTVADKVKAIKETTRTKVKGIVQEAIEAGKSTDEVAKDLRDTYKGFAGSRAQTIARTEVHAAANFGSQEGAAQTGLPLEKEWIATEDDRTRESHAILDGEKRGMEDHYSNGLLFPADPGGDAAEVINCRCAEGYHVKREEM